MKHKNTTLRMHNITNATTIQHLPSPHRSTQLMNIHAISEVPQPIPQTNKQTMTTTNTLCVYKAIQGFYDSLDASLGFVSSDPSLAGLPTELIVRIVAVLCHTLSMVAIHMMICMHLMFSISSWPCRTNTKAWWQLTCFVTYVMMHTQNMDFGHSTRVIRNLLEWMQGI